MGKKQLRFQTQGKALIKRQPSPLTARRLVLVASASIGLFLGFFLLLSQSQAIKDFITNFTAWFTGVVLNLIGWEITRTGSVLTAGSTPFQIVIDCTPVGPLMLLWGAMLALPGRWTTRLVGMAMGAIILSSVNLVRLVNLVYVAAYWPQMLNTAHLLVWQPLMILAGVLVFFFYMQRVSYAFTR